MELNGVANIKMMVEMAVMENTESHTTLSPVLADKILEQLDLLNRYMVAYSNVSESLQKAAWAKLDLNGSICIPAWHEVKANPKKYPTLREFNEKAYMKGK